MIILVLLPLFSVNSFAAMDLLVDESRFMCRILSSDRALLSFSQSGAVIVSFRGKAPDLFIERAEVSRADGCNAIRFVLENDSDCNLMRVTCVYGGEGAEAIERDVSIERRSGKRDYFLYLENIEQLKSLSISFSGGSIGTITVYGIGAASLYDDSAVRPGSITDCVYDAASDRVTVSGNIHHEITANTRNATVALYAFDYHEAIDEAILAEASPIATVPFSVRFEISVPAPTFAERFMQYVAAIVDAEGRILYWYAPCVPCTPSEKSKADASAFKGVLTEHTSLATGADVGLAVVDVFLDRLQSEKNNGLLHITEGTYYYINRSYISALDDVIGQYGKNQTRVYLRFLISGKDGSALFFDEEDEVAEASYRGISLVDDDAFLMLYAYTEFLCNRYSTEQMGRVNGIIVGNSVDRVAEYNAMANENLVDYTERYCDALYVISEAARQVDRTVEIVVPVSDIYDNDRGTTGTADSYPARLFLISLCKRMDDHYGAGLSFRVLLDSDSLPTIIRESNDSAAHVSVDNVSEWKAQMDVLAEEYDCYMQEFIYCWHPTADLSETEFLGAYVYSYYKMHTLGAYSMVVAPAAMDDAGDVKVLFDMIKYIDTQLGETKTQLIAELIGVSSWWELLPGFYATSVVNKRTYVYDTALMPSSSLRGEYVMWDYQQGRSVYDWSASADCTSLLVRDADGIGRSLVTETSGDALSSEIVYAFSANEIMGVVDMFSIEVLVDGDREATYDLIFEVCGDQSSCVSKAQVRGGERTTLYVSTLHLDMSEHVRNIRLISFPAEENEGYKICISRLSAHSNTLNDRDLEDAVVEAKLEALGTGHDPVQQKNISGLGVGIVIFVLCLSALIILMLSKRTEE